jgi:hypothetical protein
MDKCEIYFSLKHTNGFVSCLITLCKYSCKNFQSGVQQKERKRQLRIKCKLLAHYVRQHIFLNPFIYNSPFELFAETLAKPLSPCSIKRARIPPLLCSDLEKRTHKEKMTPSS